MWVCNGEINNLTLVASFHYRREGEGGGEKGAKKRKGKERER